MDRGGDLWFICGLRFDRPTTKLSGRRPKTLNMKHALFAAPLERLVGRFLWFAFIVLFIAGRRPVQDVNPDLQVLASALLI